MKVSELIEQLQKFQEEHGDLEIWVVDNNEGYGYPAEDVWRYDPPKLYEVPAMREKGWPYMTSWFKPGTKVCVLG